jgi:hypothetical protein
MCLSSLPCPSHLILLDFIILTSLDIITFICGQYFKSKFCCCVSVSQYVHYIFGEIMVKIHCHTKLHLYIRTLTVKVQIRIYSGLISIEVFVRILFSLLKLQVLLYILLIHTRSLNL